MTFSTGGYALVVVVGEMHSGLNLGKGMNHLDRKLVHGHSPIIDESTQA